MRHNIWIYVASAVKPSEGADCLEELNARLGRYKFTSMLAEYISKPEQRITRVIWIQILLEAIQHSLSQNNESSLN